MSALGSVLLDIARSAQPSREGEYFQDLLRPEPLRRPPRKAPCPLAGFSSALDARAFAALKRDEGLEVEVTSGRAGSPYLFEVHPVVRL